MTRDKKKYWCHLVIASYFSDICGMKDLLSLKHGVLAAHPFQDVFWQKTNTMLLQNIHPDIILKHFQLSTLYGKIAHAVQAKKEQIIFLYIFLLHYVANFLLLELIIAIISTQYDLLNLRTLFILES